MKCDSRLLEAKEVPQISGVKTVKLVETLNPSDRKVAGNFAVLLVEVPQADGTKQMFRATQNSQVPLNTQVIRNNSGQLVGIPAVAGG